MACTGSRNQPMHNWMRPLTVCAAGLHAALNASSDTLHTSYLSCETATQADCMPIAGPAQVTWRISVINYTDKFRHPVVLHQCCWVLAS